jgi:hypothetical protein
MPSGIGGLYCPRLTDLNIFVIIFIPSQVSDFLGWKAGKLTGKG